MKTLVCFSETLTENECQCVGVEAGQCDPELPLASRSLDAIKALANSHRLYFILPQTQCSLHPVDLSWLPEKKARMAIPYALEEECSQAISQLHFAYSKHFYQNQQYLVLQIAQQALKTLMAQLEKAGLQPDLITSDWFALPPQTKAFAKDYALIHSDAFKGALPYPQLDFSETENCSDLQSFVFSDSPPSITGSENQQEDSFRAWVAKQINTRPAINLLQGAFTPKYQDQGQNRAYVVLAGLALLSVVSLLGSQLWHWQQLKKQNQAVEAKIATLYRAFFPQATQVISPRFRISRALKNQTGQESSRFWKIYHAIILSLQQQPIEVDALHYTAGNITLQISSEDFAVLESFQTALQKHRLTVKQSKAATHEGHVTATLELHL